jgi:ribonuclease-3
VPIDLIRHPFSDPALLQRALTHRSAGSHNNERLEFLGDALVNLIVAEALYQRWPRADEGDLTRTRAALVCEATLAGLARELQLGDRLELGPGELKSGGFRRDSILADAFEAVIAAIYLDAGFEACRERVLSWFAALLDTTQPARTGKDAKTRLQEWLQARQFPLPEYRLLGSEGDDHEKTFHVAAVLNQPGVERNGSGGSRRQAEQAAAQALLDELENSNEHR